MKNIYGIIFLLIVGSANSQTPITPPSIKLEIDGHIYIKCKINGSFEANLLFDTGARGLLLDEEFFKGTGIPIVNSQLSQLPGAGGAAQLITVILDRTVVSIDTITFVPPYVPLMNLREIVGEKADGIIGPDFLLPYFTKIDFIKNEMLLYENEAVTVGFDSLQLEIKNQRFYLPIEVRTNEGIVITGQAQLDFGNPGTLYLTSPAGIKYELEKNVVNKVHYFNDHGGASGRIDGFTFRASSISIGKYSLHLPDIDASTDTTGALAKSEHIGLLGISILERFDIIINFKTGMFYFKPNGKMEDKFISNLTGFMYVNKSNTENVLEINGLFQNGNAEKAGIKPHDKILEINSVAVVLLSDREIRDIFKQNGEIIELTILSGTEKKKVKLELREII